MSARRAGVFPALLAPVVVSALLLVPVATAQPPDAPGAIDAPTIAPPLTLTFVEGSVDIVRPNGVEPAAPPDLLEEDDRLVVGEGRAEIVFPDGALAHADRATDLRVDLDVRLRLVSGRLVIRTLFEADPLVVRTPAGPVQLEADGEYDLLADDLQGDTVIAVVAGRATFLPGDREAVAGPDDVLMVHPRDGRVRWARGRHDDEFRDWARRRAATMTASTAPHALPAPVRAWGADLASHGQWSTITPYGAVWFPRASGWRPYVSGSWRFTRYGWTWIDTDRWAWPLHHYGRWGHHDVRGWYWIPQRSWGPAWVGWAVAADHVAWSPLGWNARPIVDFSFGLRAGPIGLWASSWSIVPRHAFGYRGPVGRHLQDPRRLPGPVLGGFVSQMIGPRGPAGSGDRFAVRPDRRGDAPRATAPVWAQPRPAPGARSPRPADDRGVDPPRDAVTRRPGDAPPPDGNGSGVAAPGGQRPADREWSTRPSGRADDPGDEGRRGNGRRVMPVGPPVRPRDVPSDAGAGSSPSPAPRGGAVPRRGPDAGADDGGAARGRRAEPGPRPEPSNSGGRERQQGGARRPPAGDGAAGGDGGSAPGGVRRRSG